MLIAPATSSGAVDFGSNLVSAADMSIGCPDPGCTEWNATLNAANTKGTLSAPIGGVVVSFTLKKAANPASWDPIRLRAVEPLAAPTDPLWRGLASSSPQVTPTNSAGLQSFPVRLSMDAGDFLGIEQEGSSLSAFSGASTGFGAGYRLATPVLPADGSTSGSSIFGGEILLQARIEPDKDGDGFGDETQDGCPADPNTHGACAKKKKCKKKKSKSAAAGTAKKKKKCRKRKRK